MCLLELAKNELQARWFNNSNSNNNNNNNSDGVRHCIFATAADAGEQMRRTVSIASTSSTVSGPEEMILSNSKNSNSNNNNGRNVYSSGYVATANTFPLSGAAAVSVMDVEVDLRDKRVSEALRQLLQRHVMDVALALFMAMGNLCATSSASASTAAAGGDAVGGECETATVECVVSVLCIVSQAVVCLFVMLL